MKNLFYFLTLITMLSCKRNDSPNPGLANQESLGRRQAPFDINPVDVKLKNVFRNGLIEVEYTYDENFLKEEKRYSTEKQPTPYKAGKFIRKSDFVTDFQAQLYEYNVNSGTYSLNSNTSYLLSYNKPENDSIQVVVKKDIGSSYKTFILYSFDKNGFITKMTSYADEKVNASTAVIFLRDSNNNIVRSWQKETSAPKSGEVVYTYDNQPNPFFKLGIDWGGETNVGALSPNNILNETHLGPTGSVVSTFKYKYEYLPNGYPSKVTVSVDRTNFQRFDYSFEFNY